MKLPISISLLTNCLISLKVFHVEVKRCKDESRRTRRTKFGGFGGTVTPRPPTAAKSPPTSGGQVVASGAYLTKIP